MEIRILNQQEILPALHLVWEVFAEETAPRYTPEGVAEFQKFIKYENLLPMLQSGGIIFFGAYEGPELTGTLALMSDGHIALFFVRKNWQRKGIGRMLFQSAYNFAAQRLGVRKLTVNSAPSAVEAYLHLGMQITGEEQTQNGITYVPMEVFVIPGLVQPVKKSKKPVILAAVIGACLLIAVGVAGFFLVRNVASMMEQSARSREAYDYFGDGGGYYDDGGDFGNDSSQDDTEELTGIDAIEEKIADDLSYELEEDVYSENGEQNSTVMIDFYVNYPVISGMEDTQVQDAVNETIQKTAMQTVDEIYENPSTEIRDRVLQASTPALISYVEYKVCYASNDFISIVFGDNSYKGSEEYYDPGLRTLNISLKDGAVYQVKDIVDLSGEFLNEWAQGMRDEADNEEFLSELDQDAMKSMLEGNSEDGAYVPNFFVCADGIEIGFDLNYPEGDANDLGYIWVTAPFELEELEAYQTDSEFWSMIGN